MEFPLSREVAGRFEYLVETGSTNDVLVAHATGADASGWPDLSVVVTDNQTRGRGRLGRTWLAPTGKSLAISVLLRPRLPPTLIVPDETDRHAGPSRPELSVSAGEPLPMDQFGWFPLLAGAAMTLAVRDVVAESSAPAEPADDEQPRHEVTLKWPNDVLIDGYKVSGILCELLPGGGVVIGAGLNVSLDEHDLPTLTSTSLLLVTGTSPDPDAVLAGYLTRLRELYDRFVSAAGDPVASGLHDRVVALCGTLGAAVRVELPGGTDLVGTAVRLDEDGRLVVRDQADNELLAVAAGDVTHLRY
ncbi:biotin--[acetyl-CoA-carboxylase] ligase [Cryobacterium tepidiphilum]|uniref:biotin--[biotin carboxyl-carrier protein] ligase n=1 Tax=Cryobacterium tepidiphilum TaxID=2486026 RepID=A0A3M8L2Z1_9MICO|nr:biotin--[acetyl-CoA-carboxylase] ligase [Cryobacterium tepidiphilum]RNE59102.1 biotin--[acetyl-CoA-carboxylase] ligase [Cryobacterium tepidiphilum]